LRTASQLESHALELALETELEWRL